MKLEAKCRINFCIEASIEDRREALRDCYVIGRQSRPRQPITGLQNVGPFKKEKLEYLRLAIEGERIGGGEEM